MYHLLWLSILFSAFLLMREERENWMIISNYKIFNCPKFINNQYIVIYRYLEYGQVSISINIRIIDILYRKISRSL